jgi:tRNA pseudouridine65 synthase
MLLEVLYQDQFLIAINKPHGLFVHKTGLTDEKDVFAIQLLRDQIGQQVFPVHRLDRKTSGVLLFALNRKMISPFSLLFENKSIAKKYHAIVRGYTEAEGVIDYALTNDKGKIQDAITHYKTIEKVEVPYALGKYTSQRYSLVEVKPETGRMHQIRKHFAHILHPIIGDRPHGCNKQNKFFKEQWDITTMMLHATELSFIHPVTEINLTIKADLSPEILKTIDVLGFSSIDI